ncbi:DoxX family protein [Rhizobium sp. CFBP 8762]|uniref:DoxX family protein n=1 Tax=Rhizobium sp. CFBP 8762 TaxID=2775279 RepID=UPI0017810362|nr:DoxX family protein [Rhizobium sp. CFBP 8762]MBD8553619.1 DoxX family protein [Rhizobium sp. CFBP 8762]
MSSQQSTIVLIGRVLLSIIFIIAGFGKLTGFAGTVAYFGSIGLPVPTLVAALVVVVELLGGIAILVGAFTRPVAYVLAAFCIATAFIAHFNFADQGQMNNFMKNFAMAGGFLVLAAFGPGALSVDARRRV